MRSESCEDRIDRAIAEYLAACDAGLPPDRTAFLAGHPDIADSLAAFLDDHARMRDAVADAGAGSTATLPTADLTPTRPPAESFPTRAWDGREQPPAPLGEPVCLFGDYELQGELARGGMGVVYKARQVTLDRPVALKMIRSEELATPQAVARFRTEAELAATLDHPNIVPIYEVGECRGRHYYAMRLVEGGGLNRYLHLFREDPRAAALLVARIARAVAHAHRRGVLHRDLKPSNILLDWRDGVATPHVADFGLAKRAGVRSDELTASGAVLGTPEYMAPEQARGEKGLTVAVDVYALGGILYSLLAGRPPFRSENLGDLLRDVADRDPPSLRSFNPVAPRDLEVVALKCLRKDPAQRYGSAEELADDLERWAAGQPIRARPVGRAERTWKWVRRNPSVAALWVVVAAVAVGSTVAAVRFADLAGDEKQARGDAERQKEIADDQTRIAREKAEAAEGARRDADDQTDLAQGRLGRVYVENGLRVAAGDPGAALLWFAEALKWDGRSADRAEAHRRRIASYLNGGPLPEHVFPVPAGEPVKDERGQPTTPSVLVPEGGRHLALTGAGRPTVVWDRLTGEELFRVAEPGALTRDRFLPGDRRFLVRRGNLAQLWDVEARKPLTDRLPGFRAVSPDGRLLVTEAVGGEPRLVVWETETGKPRGSLPVTAPAPLAAVAFSPLSDRLVYWTDANTGRVIDAHTLAPVGEPFTDDRDAGGRYRSPEFVGADHRWVRVRLRGPGRPDAGPDRWYEAATGRRADPPAGVPEEVIAARPGERWVLHRLPFLSGEPAAVAALVGAGAPPAGPLPAALLTRATIAPTSGGLLKQDQPPVNTRFLPAPVGRQPLQVWDADGLKPLGPVISFPTRHPGGEWPTDIQLLPRPGGATPVVATKVGNVVTFWDAATGSQVGRIDIPGASLRRFTLSPRGEFLFTGGYEPGSTVRKEDTIRVYHWPRLDLLGQPLQGTRWPLDEPFVCAPDDRHFVVWTGGTQTVYRFDRPSFNPPRYERVGQIDEPVIPPPGFGRTPQPPQFSPTGRFLVLRSDKTAPLWVYRVADAKPALVVRDQPDPVEEWWFADGDTRLYTRDRTAVKAWDLLPHSWEEPRWQGPQLQRSMGGDEDDAVRLPGGGLRSLSAVPESRRGTDPVSAVAGRAFRVGLRDSAGTVPPSILTGLRAPDDRRYVQWQPYGRPATSWVPGFELLRPRFGPDGRQVFTLGTTTGERDHTPGALRGWDVDTGNRLELPELPVGKPKAFPHPTAPAVAIAEGSRVYLILRPVGQITEPPLVLRPRVRLPAEITEVRWVRDRIAVVTDAGGRWAVLSAEGAVVLPAEAGPVRDADLAFAPGKPPRGLRVFAVAGEGQEFRMWDTTTRQPVGPVMRTPVAADRVVIPNESRLLGLPDSPVRTLAVEVTGADGLVRRYDPVSGRQVGEPTPAPAAVAPAPHPPVEGKVVFDRDVRFENESRPATKADRVRFVATDKALHSFDPDERPVGPAIPLDEPVLGLLPWPSGGNRLVVVVLTPSGFAAYDLRTGKPTDALSAKWLLGKVVAAQVTPGRSTVTQFPDDVLLVGANAEVWTFRGSSIRSVIGPGPVFERHGGYAAFTVSLDRKHLVALTPFGEARVWDVTGPRPRLLPWSIPGPVTFLQYSDDAKSILAGDDHELSLWDAATGQRRWATESPSWRVKRASFLAGGRIAVEGEALLPAVSWPGNRESVWGAEPGMIFLSVLAPPTKGEPRATPSLQVFDAATGRLDGPAIPADRGFEVTPDGRYLLAAAGTPTAPTTRAWDTGTGKEVANPELPGDPWQSLKSADWRYYLELLPPTPAAAGSATTTGVATYRLRSGRTGKAIGPELPAKLHQPVGFSADARYVLVGGRVYETATGVPVTRTPDDPNTPLPPWEVRFVSSPTPSVRTARVWEWVTAADPRPVEEALRLARLAAGREIDEGGGLVPLTGERLATLAAGPKPDGWGAKAVRVNGMLNEAERAELTGDLGAAVAWLERAASLAPREGGLVRRLNLARRDLAGDFLKRPTILADGRPPLRPWQREGVAMFEQLLRDAPELAAGELRVLAAVAAVRAGTGRDRRWSPLPPGKSGVAPQPQTPQSAPTRVLWDAEHARLRAQGLTWLSAELEAIRGKMVDGAAEREKLAEVLAAWLADPALEPVRAAGELARLPEAEQGVWFTFWADVRRLSQAVGPARP